MALSLHLLLFCSFLGLNFFPPSYSRIILPITKDRSTLQYLTTISHGTPLGSSNLVVDLNCPFLWMDCASAHVSTSTRPIPTRSLQCSRARTYGSSSDSDSTAEFTRGNSTCGLSAVNSVTRFVARVNLMEDRVAVPSLDGSIITVDQFLYSCGLQSLLQGLSKSAKGMLGLGRSQVSLPSQIATEYGLNRGFSLCLSSTNGVVLSDNENFPTYFGKEISRSLSYTPLVTSKAKALQDYFIDIKAIKINNEQLPLNTSLLVFDEDNSKGGSKLSTTVPYTVMESSIYATFTATFKKAAATMIMIEVAPVSPFELCFSSKNIGMTLVGPEVPEIDVVLQSGMVKWRIYGRNSMVKVSEEVMCLGFIDGGFNTRTSIVLGGYQLEDILLHFNLGTSMLGFSSSLLARRSTCSDFVLERVLKESL